MRGDLLELLIACAASRHTVVRGVMSRWWHRGTVLLLAGGRRQIDFRGETANTVAVTRQLHRAAEHSATAGARPEKWSDAVAFWRCCSPNDVADCNFVRCECCSQLDAREREQQSSALQTRKG